MTKWKASLYYSLILSSAQRKSYNDMDGENYGLHGNMPSPLMKDGNLSHASLKVHFGYFINGNKK